MHITLSPVRLDETLTAAITGEVLTLNGETFDFTKLPKAQPCLPKLSNPTGS